MPSVDLEGLDLAAGQSEDVLELDRASREVARDPGVHVPARALLRDA
jgi:hypothetical protein